MPHSDPARPRLLVAPDKFRGTATAREVTQAAVLGAQEADWSADGAPMADGGEGLLEIIEGDERESLVTGPLGKPVRACWKLIIEPEPFAGESHVAQADEPKATPSHASRVTAVIEMATAAGLSLVGGRERNDPLLASTTGVGELVLFAIEAGANRIVVGLGGSATTDGGWGAVEAIGDRARLAGVEIIAACDVQTCFLDAPSVFGPQKGAHGNQIHELERRLTKVAASYEQRFGVDVTQVAGAGAAGGLAGGLAALGARLVPGFPMVAELVGLPLRLQRAQAVMTGEGRLDTTSLDGKVVGSLLDLVAGRLPVLCVVGQAEARAVRSLGDKHPRCTVVSLSERFGIEAARRRVIPLVTEVVASELANGGSLRDATADAAAASPAGIDSKENREP